MFLTPASGGLLITLLHVTSGLQTPEPLQFNGNDLNNALLKDPALKLDIVADKSAAPNQLGIFHHMCQQTVGKGTTLFFFLSVPDGNEYFINPLVGMTWYGTVL